MPKKSVASMENFPGNSGVFKKVADSLVGRKIVDVRWQSIAERSETGWYKPAPILVLDDGTKITASEDPEGNGPGAFFINNEQVADVLP